MTERTTAVDDRLHRYLVDVSVREHDVLRQLRAETARLPTARYQVGPEQGQFMALLIELLGATRAIEIGVYTGYSALATALALPSNGLLVACDVNEEWTNVARRYWRLAGVDHKIELHLRPAAETLRALCREGQEETFDFAFVDADKTGYAEYYELCLRLVRRGGLLIFDNTLWGGAVADPSVSDPDTEALRRFNEQLRDDARISLSLVPMSDGMTLALKR